MENYQDKFERLKDQTYFNLLSDEDQQAIRTFAEQYRLTFQEIRQISEYARDMDMWQEKKISVWLTGNEFGPGYSKTEALQKLHHFVNTLKEDYKTYPDEGLKRPKKREKNKIVAESSDKNVMGECPVQSEKTVCCNLKTIDAVESCIFGCSYCTIQTFYRDKITIDADLADKLNSLKLDPKRNYHIGTGQSSDSLAFGNRDGILDSLCDFANNHPNIILELKTKSANIRYFLENDFPKNIFCSWSLNPQEIIDNEEHFTASLEDRLGAARKVADRGMKVAFHFHPIIYYNNWAAAYPELARRVMTHFDPDEVLFISFGSVTFIKPVLKKIRKMGFPTKITQMDFVTDPHGKMTYPDHIKIEKFQTMYQRFAPWKDKVFFYLCMEKSSIWQESFGWVFKDNDHFEKALFESAKAKIMQSTAI